MTWLKCWSIELNIVSKDSAKTGKHWFNLTHYTRLNTRLILGNRIRSGSHWHRWSTRRGQFSRGRIPCNNHHRVLHNHGTGQGNFQLMFGKISFQAQLITHNQIWLHQNVGTLIQQVSRSQSIPRQSEQTVWKSNFRLLILFPQAHQWILPAGEDDEELSESIVLSKHNLKDGPRSVTN